MGYTIGLIGLWLGVGAVVTLTITGALFGTRDILKNKSIDERAFEHSLSWYDSNQKEFFRIEKDGRLTFSPDVKGTKEFLDWIDKQRGTK